MSRLFSLFFVILFSQNSFSDACFERFYSERHLNRYKNQEIRNVQLSLHNKYIEEDAPEGELPETKTLHLFQLQIQLVRNGKAYVANAGGTCDKEIDDSVYDPETGNSTRVTRAECQFNNGQGQLTLLKRNNKKHSFLGELSAASVLKVANHEPLPLKEIRIPSGDLKFGLDKIKNPRYQKCEEITFLPRTQTTPRMWNEMILYSIRHDLARPTVTARNLYHLAIAMWDAYAAFDNKRPQWAKTSFRAKRTHKNLDSARDVAISYAAYTVLKSRYKDAPGNVNPADPDLDDEPSRLIDNSIDRVMKKLGNDLETEPQPDSPAWVGKEIAERLLQEKLNDGSRELENYAHDKTYTSINNKYPLDITQSGIRVPIDALDSDYNPIWPKLGGSLFDHLLDISFWNFLFVPGAIDQGGNQQESLRSPLTLFWGKLDHTFSDLTPYKSAKPGVYFDPCPEAKDIHDFCEVYPKFNERQKEQLIKDNLAVARFSSLLSPVDLKKHGKDFDGDGQLDENPGAEFIDISPVSLGNHPLGTNNGQGHGSHNPINPSKPYKKSLVRVGDFGRTIAEFWADGPDSETPPGHWNTIFNYVIDQKLKLEKNPFRFFGQGQELTREEYELRSYLALNGSLHDAAVVAWGIKGHYQGNRPISVIRKLAKKAENDSQFAKYLVAQAPDILKMVEHPQGSGRKKLFIKSWRGQAFYGQDVDGGAQDRRDYSYRNQEEHRFYTDFEEGGGEYYGGLGGTGWITAENWMPYQRQTFVTPPFPGFISGHSTFSRAAAEVLTGITGSEYFPGGLGTYQAPELVFEKGPYEPFEFQWATYFDASDQSGISRLYGGIHASYDDLPARVIGSKIGKAAVEKAKDFFE